MAQLFANAARSTLTASITSSSTQLQINPADQALFPVATGADWFKVALEDSSGNLEYMRVQRAVGQSLLTITERATEDAAKFPARSFVAGSLVELRMTAADLASSIAHPSVGTGAHAATAISVTPAGGISAATVQAALQELDSEKADASDVATALAGKASTGANTFTGAQTLPGNAVNPLEAVPKQQAEAIADAAWPVGAIMAVADLSPPSSRWLLVDGKTIGSASSGATARANADTEALFTKLWAFPEASVPIYTSAGLASTRGASAAADFAAGKRIALFTPDGGAFLRMWAPGQTNDTGRAAGSVQLDAFQGHWHSTYMTGNITATGDSAVEDGPRTAVSNTANTAVLGAISDNVSGTPRTASETRPYNLSMPHYIKL